MSKKKYFTDEEKRNAKKEKNKRYQLKHKKQIKNYQYDYRNTLIGRAINCLVKYRASDKKYNRGECTLTAEWIAENILSKPCVHCGESDWHKIGCNRLDNSLPHTSDNVEPCCLKCNLKLAGKEKSKPVYQYTLEGELVKIWPSTMECKRNGFNQSSVNSCCLGKRKTHKGYIWSYVPL